MKKSKRRSQNKAGVSKWSAVPGPLQTRDRLDRAKRILIELAMRAIQQAESEQRKDAA